jgi:hypothetical protein
MRSNVILEVAVVVMDDLSLLAMVLRLKEIRIPQRTRRRIKDAKNRGSAENVFSTIAALFNIHPFLCT